MSEQKRYNLARGKHTVKVTLPSYVASRQQIPPWSSTTASIGMILIINACLRKPLMCIKISNALKNVSTGISSKALAITSQNVPSTHPVRHLCEPPVKNLTTLTMPVWKRRIPKLGGERKGWCVMAGCRNTKLGRTKLISWKHHKKNAEKIPFGLRWPFLPPSEF